MRFFTQPSALTDWTIVVERVLSQKEIHAVGKTLCVQNCSYAAVNGISPSFYIHTGLSNDLIHFFTLTTTVVYVFPSTN